MELILSAISSGGLIGAADQYLCLLLLSVAANQKWVEVSPEMGFMGSWWFIAMMAVFWLLTVAPAYSSTFAPGIMNTVNTVVNFLSGFAVPFSAALLSLASIGIIVNLNPELQQMLDSMQLFSEGGVGNSELMIAGGAATVATALTGVKALAKPIVSTSTGTVGHTSAPIFATVEAIASVLLMGMWYILSNVDPRLLIALMSVVVIIMLAITGYALYQLWRMKKGIGQLIHLIQTQPKAGWAVLAEFFIWGSGWLVWGPRTRGIKMLALWGLYIALWWVLFGVMALMPFLLVLYIPMTIMLFIFTGIYSARNLMQRLEDTQGVVTLATI